ncbi:DUF5050 domain-containing protein [Candidatus Poribacteria bacterium]|nr:DUF5050 domain-containing protein [Candidatus Poribacteria bacterium]
MQGFRNATVITLLVWNILLTILVAAKGSEIVFTSNRDKGDKHSWVEWEIYVMDADGQNVRRLTNNEFAEYQPVWSPDGAQIAFASMAEEDADHPDIFVMASDGRERINLTQSPFVSEFSPTWAPDGQRIAFVKFGGEVPNMDIYVMDINGHNITQLNQPGVEQMPAWSPDGKWVAYVSRTNEWDANDEIYLIKPDGTNKRKLTNRPTNMDTDPAWSPDGKRIAFISYDLTGENLYEIFVMDADGNHVTNLTPSGYYYSLSWSPDGEQIVFSSSQDEDTGLYVMDAAGQNIRRLTGGAIDWYVDWSKSMNLPAVNPQILLKTSWGAIKRQVENKVRQ